MSKKSCIFAAKITYGTLFAVTLAHLFDMI